MNNNNKQAQSGFSLIELLIAMLIGLFLLAGIASSYVNSKTSSVKRDQVSLLEDNGRLVLEIISKAVEHTGYTPPGTFLDPPFITDLAADVISDACPTIAIQNIVDTSIFRATEDDDVLGDTLGVIYRGDDNIFTDCSGNILPVECRTGVNSSKIYNNFYIDNVDNTLVCAGSRGATPQIIADGVENIQFLYGVDRTGNGVVNRYVNKTNVGVWNSIVSIQVAVLVRSLRQVKNIAESKQFTLLDTVVTSPSDKFQRAVFSTTIRLRNTL